MPNSVLQLTMVSPEGLAFKGSADMVHVATEMGEIEIFPGHMSLVSSIGFGKALVKEGATTHEFIVRHGIISCDQDTNEVRLEAFACQKIADIKQESLLEYREYILGEMKRNDLTKFQTQFLEEQESSIQQLLEVVSPTRKTEQ